MAELFPNMVNNMNQELGEKKKNKDTHKQDKQKRNTTL